MIDRVWTIRHVLFRVALYFTLQILSHGQEIKENSTYPKKYSGEEHPSFWFDSSSATLKDKLAQQQNLGEARNVILFLGDGMGMSSITGGRVFKGQRSNMAGAETSLTFEQFPYTALAKTYSVDGLTTDSAASATAYLCGVKTNIGILGLTGSVKLDDCSAATNKDNQLESIFAWAQAAGKWTGFVTTDEVVGASPAGGYAQTPNRDWYSSVPEDCGVKDLADQLIHGKVGKEFKIVLGGGWRHFLPNESKPTEQNTFKNESSPINQKGMRHDGRNLIDEYLNQNSSENVEFVWSRQQLASLDACKVDRVLGLFHENYMSYSLDVDYNDPSNTEPTLAEMTDFAIQLLSQNPNGFLLFVESANIDWAHHYNMAEHALDEVRQLDEAVDVVLEAVSTDESLILVTADHSHSLTINGYSPRERTITGFTDEEDGEDPYRILSYATGPGNNSYLSLYQIESAAHSGEDVAVYAIGPYAHLFSGTIENTFIAYLISFASCIGPNKNMDCSAR